MITVGAFFGGFYVGFVFFLGWYRIFERNKGKETPREFRRKLREWVLRSHQLTPYEKDVVAKAVDLIEGVRSGPCTGKR